MLEKIRSGVNALTNELMGRKENRKKFDRLSNSKEKELFENCCSNVFSIE